jgi:hypothetical protein
MRPVEPHFGPLRPSASLKGGFRISSLTSPERVSQGESWVMNGIEPADRDLTPGGNPSLGGAT